MPKKKLAKRPARSRFKENAKVRPVKIVAPTRFPRGTLVDEEVLLEQLTLDASVQNLKLMRMAAPAAILSAYDRGVKREFMVEVINNAIAFNEQARALSFMDNILGFSKS